jgi:DNA-directed RNA polymerase subunit RPC12/RpoP
VEAQREMENKTINERLVCAHCGSTNLRTVRHEYGTKGQWNYWWVEQMECSDCGKKMLPRELIKSPTS